VQLDSGQQNEKFIVKQNINRPTRTQKVRKMKNELKVEHYDASKVEAKKRKILKIVSTGVGAVALSTMLGCYGLKKGAESANVKQDLDTAPIIVTDTVPVIEPIKPMETFILGGGGAWFNSVIEFLEA
jgi:hypothetical protein